MLKAYSYAKINLFLYVTSKRADGYHDLYSLITRVNLFDFVALKKNEKFCIQSNIIELSDSTKNVIYKLYLKLKDKYNIKPCKVILYKNIPIGAGLGGGSSNASVFLELLTKLYKLPLSLEEKNSLLSTLSADSPYFLYTGARIVTGIGNIISNEIILPKFYILLLKPPISLLTKEIYESGYVNITLEPPTIKSNLLFYNNLMKYIHNDLEEAVFYKEPYIMELKKLLKKHGADASLVTGSGSAFFGIFSSKLALINAYNYFHHNFNDLKVYKLTNI
jgi:4-diphosphocytidyl-2-C-methyl-D-erythritol kinase